MLSRHTSSMSGDNRAARRSKFLMTSAVPARSFRYLDNPAESGAIASTFAFLPPIMTVLPLEFRHRLMPQDDICRACLRP